MILFKNWKSKSLSKKQQLTFIALLLLSANAYSQNVVSLRTIIDSSLVNNPSIKAANASVKQQQHLVKSAMNLPSPEILLQNPTGTFYTVGAQQSFDFPTVYGSQRKIQKENVKLAEISKNRYPKLAVVGDLRKVLLQILKKMRVLEPTNLECTSEWLERNYKLNDKFCLS